MLSRTGLLLPFEVESATVEDPPLAVTGSLNVTVTVSPVSALPPVPPALFAEAIEVGTGPAPSAGALGAELALPAASRIPFPFAASPIVNEPTAVSFAPLPSFKFRVAVDPETVTDASVPPDGTLLSVHGLMPAVYESSDESNVAVTSSTLPLWSVSSIVIDVSAGAVRSIVNAAPVKLPLPAPLPPNAVPARSVIESSSTKFRPIEPLPVPVLAVTV